MSQNVKKLGPNLCSYHIEGFFLVGGGGGPLQTVLQSRSRAFVAGVVTQFFWCALDPVFLLYKIQLLFKQFSLRK